MNDPCEHEHVLSAFLDQALTPAQACQVAEHLAACAACRRRLEALRQTDVMIRELPSMTPSAGFDAAFWRKVAALEEKQARPFPVRRWLAGWRPFLAAGLAASVVAGFLLWHHPARRPAVEEAYMVEHIEMLSDFEIIQHLELFENWDAVQKLKDQG